MKLYYVTSVIRGKMHWLNNCDGFSEQKRGGRKFSVRSDAERAIHSIRADARWSGAHPIQLMTPR